MWLQFFAQNAHFAINLFAALVSLGVCWLYFDAWSNRRESKELFKWTGFAVLGLSFFFQATIIEQSVLGDSLLGDWSEALTAVARFAGYILIIIGQIIDPLQVIPKNEGLKLPTEISPTKDLKPEAPKTAPVGLSFAATGSKWLMPLSGLVVAGLYWRRATVGLERHLKPVALAFLFFAISDSISLTHILRDTTNPVIFSWVAAFGWVWWLQQLTLVAGLAMLGKWTWGYLTERFFSQLFMIFTGMIVVVFLVVSVGFTGLLLRNVQSNSLVNLSTAANVLGYALESKQSEASSSSQQLAGSTDIVTAIISKDREKLKKSTSTFLADKRLTDVIITDQSGQVLLRGQDTEQWGDSVSSDALVKRALLGLGQSTVNVYEGVGAPVIQVRSTAVVKDESNTIVGSVTSSLELGTAFVDGIKESTGLESSVYAGDQLAATTLLTPNGKSRPVGVKLTDEKIKETVIVDGGSYSGTANLQNRQMLTVFLPIRDADTVPVGMLLIAQPQSSILLTAGRSVELTFLLATLLIILSFVPTYLVTRSLTRQLE